MATLERATIRPTDDWTHLAAFGRTFALNSLACRHSETASPRLAGNRAGGKVGIHDVKQRLVRTRLKLRQHWKEL
jgi:hypothetical protein